MAATPILYVILAFVVTGAFVYRYALGGLFGICVVFADLVWHWLGPRRLAVWSLCAVLFACFVGLRTAPAIAVFANPAARQELQAELAAIESLASDSSRPIAVSPPHVFFEYAHYASPSLRGRLIYLADPGLALEHTGTDSGERALMNVAPWAGLRVEDYKHFHDSGRSFYLAQRKRHSYDWLAPELASEGIEMQVLRDTPQRRLMLCSWAVAEGQALAEGSQKGGD